MDEDFYFFQEKDVLHRNAARLFYSLSSILQRFHRISLFPCGQIQGDRIASLGKEKGAGGPGGIGWVDIPLHCWAIA